jgi:Bacteroidetes-specific putative membrane protein
VIIKLLYNNTGILSVQDTAFSQHFCSQLCLNPAFAYHAEDGRITIIYCNQDSSFGNVFSVYNASYDQYFSKDKSGIYKRASVNLMYSHKVTLSRQQRLGFGAKVGYYKESLDYRSLVFDDQLDAESCSISSNISSEIIPDNLTPSAADFAVSLLWSLSNSLYVGISIDHLTFPQLSYYSGNDNNILKPKFTTNAGFCFNVTQSRFGETYPEDFSIRPSFVYQQQDKQQQFIIGTDTSLATFHAGCWFRQVFPIRSAIVFHTAIEYMGMAIEHNYDTVLNTSGHQAMDEAYEMSIIHEFGGK